MVIPAPRGGKPSFPDRRQSLAPEVVATPDEPLTLALHQAQDNLLALERLAEQTAALHRQFLEGRGKDAASLSQVARTATAFVARWLRCGRNAAATIRAICRRPIGRGVENFAAHASLNGPIARDNPGDRQGLSGARRGRCKRAGIAAYHGALEPGASRTTAGSAAAILIEVVAEKTGYPAAALDLDMQLDADLGIDSIKRVEILSALQDRLTGLPELKPEQLGSFRTLRAIVDFISQFDLMARHALPRRSAGDSHEVPNAM